MSPRRERAFRDRDRRTRRWTVVTTAAEFTQHRTQGTRRIEVRRTVTDPPQPTLIDLGEIPTGIDVRVTGTAAVCVTGGHLRVSDAGHIEATGTAVVAAYDHATVTAFDTATITGRHHTRITLCDTSHGTGYDHTAIAAWDTSHATAHNDTIVVVAAGDPSKQPTIHLADDAHLYTDARLTVTGPARDNIVHSPDPFAAAPVDLGY